MTNETEPGVGHNRVAGVDGAKLLSFVERIERLTDEKKSIAADIRDVYKEAVGLGFDRKAMARCVRERAKDAATRKEEEDTFDVYSCALGVFA